MKRRYMKISDIKIGDKIIFDNISGYSKDIPKANYVGQVLEVVDDKNIKVKFLINSVNEVDIVIPFFLAQ